MNWENVTDLNGTKHANDYALNECGRVSDLMDKHMLKAFAWTECDRVSDETVTKHAHGDAFTERNLVSEYKNTSSNNQSRLSAENDSIVVTIIAMDH